MASKRPVWKARAWTPLRPSFVEACRARCRPFDKLLLVCGTVFVLFLALVAVVSMR